MTQLVNLKGKDVFTNSMIISENAGIQHESVMRLLNRHKSDFSYFGTLRFTDLKSENSKGGRPIKVCDLNEQQATLLLTYMDNTEQVRKFKVNLVDQFYKMKSALMQKQSSEWLQTRKHGKLVRRNETDAITELIEYAKEQGSHNANMFYVNYSKMVNKVVGIETGQREIATDKTLSVIALVEDLILNTVKEQMAQGIYYKEIYKNCKAKSETLMQYIYFPTGRLLLGEPHE
jgi:phage regulator Rha-like protein